ncbi:MAG: hypothetical protein OXI39_02370 [Gemmatimonadota bacterium]|uniref:hypothetical protein n=1 Tax=Candidatus Palauibacter scopulicola TaxID=3056741 RepID=UPI0023934D3E|nr:hypothetical protein [Candidatus Palauibacter scopulicola]MDE2661835.1 hypothetical protein [Candidatus Palauibacter scopulicola]
MNGTMNIIKASMLNALRRRWKLALVVFLFGVGLVIFTHAYDMTALENVRISGTPVGADGGEPTPEEVEAMARRAGMFVLFALLMSAFAFGTMLLAFLMPGGMVANERRSGAIMLWAQHPMPLRSFYLRRYAGVQIATVAALAIFGLTWAVVVPPGTGTALGLGELVSLCLTGVVACAISFAITALGVRRAALIGVLYFMLSGTLAGVQLTSFEMGRNPETWSAAETVGAVLPFLIFPSGVIDDFVAGFGSAAAWDWGATGLVLYHLALWTGIAWIGLLRIEKRPLKL